MTRLRRWLAWKLTCLARRLHDPGCEDTLTLTVDGTTVLEVTVAGDSYGRGVLSVFHPQTPGVRFRWVCEGVMFDDSDWYRNAAEVADDE